MTEKAVVRHSSLQSPPTKADLGETSAPSGQHAPCHQGQGVLIVEEHRNSAGNGEATQDSDFELQEALRNFQSYIDILREWDEKEKARSEPQSTQTERCD